MNWPKVTVLMAVKNSEKYLEQSIKSILQQQYKNFAFLIIDDASEDQTPRIIKSFRDKRIRLITNKKAVGLTKNLNFGMKMSLSKYIVRMDADDLAHRTRIKKQVDFMEKNPSIDVSGSWIKTLGVREYEWKFPVSDSEIKMELLFSNPLAHPSIIIRPESFKRFNIEYDEHYLYSQDFELWARSIKYLNFSNIGEVLLFYRLRKDHFNALKQAPKQKFIRDIYRFQLSRLGLDVNKEDVLTKHLQFVGKNHNLLDFINIPLWSKRLYEANLTSRVYNPNEFRNYLIKKTIGRLFL